MKLIRCEDVIVLPGEAKPESWLLYNVRTRTSLGVDPNGLELWLHSGSSEADSFHTWNTRIFSNTDGTLDDPSQYIKSPEQWEPVESKNATQVIDALKKQHLLIEDPESYAQLTERKAHLLDRTRLGNFHDRTGHHLLLEKKVNPSEWWLDQKFSKDRKTIRKDSLYGTVQEPFLEKYFKQRFQAGMHVLDLGCGMGHYTRMMSTSGAEVTGIDPNEDYIKQAQEYEPSTAKFECHPLGQANALKAISDESYDIVFVSDALLFYFIPVKEGELPDIKVFLNEIRRILKPNGHFVFVEPHPVFYLAPWLGAKDKPFTILADYTKRTFSTTPDFSTLLKTIFEHKFAMVAFEELGTTSKTSHREEHFANEFPIWIFAECIKLD